MKDNIIFLKLKKISIIALGAAILSFGLYNIHQQVNITEGGVLGLLLLINHWFDISPTLLTPFLDGICYLIAFRSLGWNFIRISAVSTLFISAFFRLWELFPPVFSKLAEYPLHAAVLGGLFVGIGVGLIVKQGGSSGGDDALALTISMHTGWRLSRSYLLTDLTVLLLSLTYIPLTKLIFSLITVTISSFTIDLIHYGLPFDLTREEDI